METKLGTIVLRAVKLVIFICLFITSWMMYKAGNFFIGTTILLVLSIYLIFNKIESMDRRLKKIERG